jgi:nickel-dependent lactate racemase
LPSQIDIRYGTSAIPVTIPDQADVTVIRKPAMPVLANPADAVVGALTDSVGCSALVDLATGATTACIAICDITRPVPNHLFLRPIIEQLLSAGVPASGITVLIATGLHRPNEGDELEELIGDPWVTKNVRVVNHFARNDADHITLGRTETRGTAVRIDKRFVDADVRIATGLVEPHFMAGYSGGRKLIAPGLAHAETITTFHSSRFMSDPAAANCNFVGNPLHEEQLEIVRMLGQCYAINTVIDEERQLSFINFGEIINSHSQAVDFVRQYCEVPIDRKFHTVLTSAAGYPLDKTYYQTIKGMVGPMDILADGGDLIIASQCSEGMGSPEFVEAQERLRRLGPDAFLQSILAKSHADIDEWQTQMQLKPMSIGNVQLFSDQLSATDRAITGVAMTDNINVAVSESIRRSRDKAIAIIPEGPYVVPMFRPVASSR